MSETRKRAEEALAKWRNAPPEEVWGASYNMALALEALLAEPAPAPKEVPGE